MLLGGHFHTVRSISPDEVRRLVQSKPLRDYCLVDVRQPAEYEAGHLPGARLLPLAGLQKHLDALDPGRLTVVYCRSGNRSRSAAGLLDGAGFGNVHNMEGGILAYNGVVASGPPEAGVFCFPEDMAPEELVAMAWYLEDGSRRFCRRVREMDRFRPVSALVGELEAFKTRQLSRLEGLYREVAADGREGSFPTDVLAPPPTDVMAGCVGVEEAVVWSSDGDVRDLLDYVLALEANTFDLYLKLARRVRSEPARRVFSALAEEASRHLKALAAAFERTI
jgi:rhodanese-related sulfurtransferase